MSRDYKNRAHNRRRKTLSPWLGVIAGLLVGLFVAALVYIKLQAQQPEPVYVQETLPPVVADTQQDVRDVRKDDDPQAIPPPPKPRFDFYTRLPEIEVVVPEEEITQSLQQAKPPLAAPPPVEAATPEAPVSEPEPAVASTAPAEPPVETPASGHFFLQVGSFSDAGKADRFKAELALMGLQTSIQTVTINNKDTYHRVRVGPFSTLNQLDKTRQQLKQKGIDSTPLKVRG